MDHTKRFDGKGTLYANARPSYATEGLAYLARMGIGIHKTVADVGAGTGIFSRQLLDLGCTVYAIEPNEDMRRQMVQLLHHPRLQIVCAPAEHTTLPNQSVDAVTAAQAFHWFNPIAFRDECRRILKPSGFAALLWNHRPEDSPLVQAYSQIYRQFSSGFQGHSNGLQQDDARIQAFFSDYQVHTFPHALTYGKQAFIERALSSSYAPRHGDASYRPFLAALETLFEQYAHDDVLQMPNETVIYTGTV